MSMIYRRYRSGIGYARPVVYLIFAAAFGLLAVWAAVRADWLVATVALAAAITAAAAPLATRRLAHALEASSRPAPDHPDGGDHD